MTTRQAWCARCDGVVLADERGCIACTSKQIPFVIAAFCAICVDGIEGLRTAQLEEGGPLFTICKRCDEDDAGKTRGYHGARDPRGPSVWGWR